MIERTGYRIVFSLGLIFLGTTAFAQLSPGKLSRAHAHLEGLSNCTKCHLLGEKVSGDKCLECHTEIASRIKAQQGYHASAGVRAGECINCHSDHHGREFQMIRFEPSGFDHTLTGYPLEGTHARLICGDCHRAENIINPVIRQRENTYLGLNRNCLSCHKDPHQGTLSEDCSSCHDNRVFKPASKFEHSRTRFRLLGKHRDTDCRECHRIRISNGKEMQEFAGIDFENCTSCHKDVHEDKFGQNCVQCHSEESFKKIKQLRNFNHSMTGYPLEGQHRFVSCAKCHKARYTEAIEFKHCSDCHSDYHEKQFAREEGSPDCSDCHTTTGFDRSEYTLERHNRSQFTLTGAHLATPCFACHKRTNKWSFREIGEKCLDCHRDIHKPFLDEKYYGEASCESCHSTDSWGDIDFDHSETGFRLEGAHLDQACRSCHFRADEKGTIHQEFSRLQAACLTCHQDVHYRQFEKANDQYCLNCHGYSDWSADRFNHDRTAFPLEGKHREVACAKCHSPVVQGEITYIQYKIDDFSCESCH